MTDDRPHRPAARIGGVADTVVLGTFAVAAAAVVVVFDASSSLLAVGIATIAGMFAGDVVSSALSGRPMFWRRPPAKTHWSATILGLVFITLVGSYLESSRRCARLSAGRTSDRNMWTIQEMRSS